MRYKLINLKTKEETICSKIELDGFDYYINDSDLINCKCFDFNQYKIVDSIFYNIKESYVKKIIATNNPNIDIPKVVDEAKIISENYFRYKIVGSTWYEVFEEGYTKSQQTHPFSLEDMIKFAKWIANAKLHGFSKQLYEAMIVNKVKTIEELIEIWNNQRLKTIYYE